MQHNIKVERISSDTVEYTLSNFALVEVRVTHRGTRTVFGPFAYGETKSAMDELHWLVGELGKLVGERDLTVKDLPLSQHL